MMRLKRASACCPTCHTTFENLPVEYDEDGGFALLPLSPCYQDGCHKLLCPRCDQGRCEICGDTFCADHLVSVPDGTDRPLLCCRSCAADLAEPAALPARIGPGRVTKIPALVPAVA